MIAHKFTHWDGHPQTLCVCGKQEAHALHHPPEGFGIPYFRAVKGPDNYYWWAKCPACSVLVKNTDGMGPANHWKEVHT
jgi:hypothetical protein